jgi:hypothetical protein
MPPDTPSASALNHPDAVPVILGPSTPTGEAAAQLDLQSQMAQWQMGKLLEMPTIENSRRWTDPAFSESEHKGE